jgi:Tfp pilus assembly protein PilF
MRAMALGVPILLMLFTVWAFWPALGNGFVDWDDEGNFVRNTAFRGLGWTQIRWAFTTTVMGHYIPVTWLTLSMDYVLWGMDPLGYHLTNLIVHAAAALVVYLVALRLLGTTADGGSPGRNADQVSLAVRAGAAVAAAFFAVHPLRVESVAWITERRDGLSTLLALVAVLAYLAAVTDSGRRRHVLLTASVTAYAAATLSKSMVMTLPVVLLILDVYPLRRLSLRWPDRAERVVLLEKVPYVVLGLVGAGLGVYAQHANRFFSPLVDVSWIARISLALHSAWFYVVSSLMPFGLSPLYERPHPFDPFAPRFVGAALAVTVAALAVFMARRRWPALLAASTAYLVMLAPVSGLAHSGHQVAHDRYSYFPSLALALLLGAGVVALVRATSHGATRPSLALGAGVALGLWLLTLGVLTRDQSQVWRDSETLWSHAVDAEPTCSICHENLAVNLARAGKLPPAMYHFEQSVKLRPDRFQAHRNLGVAVLKSGTRGAVKTALAHIETALRLAPGDHETLAAYGAALVDADEPARARGFLESALARDPDHVLARTNLGAALYRLGDHAAAAEHFTRAMALDPTSAPPRYGLAVLHFERGNTAQALVQLAEVRRLDARLAQSLEVRLTQVRP